MHGGGGNIRPFLALALALVAMFPAAAENPRLDLKLDNVTAVEAMARLTAVAGTPVELFRPDPTEGPQPPLPAGLAAKSSFDWTGVPFAQALRQLCGRYHLQPMRTPQGYTLVPEDGPPPLPIKKVGLAQKNGIRIYAQSIGTYGGRNKSFIGDGDGENGGLSLQVALELGDRDAERMEGIGDVVAQDDQGNFLVADQPHFGGSMASGYPDEWTAGFNLSPPHPRAKKLSWMEGTLYTYRTFKTMRAEVPLPLAQKQVRTRLGDWLIVVSRYEPAYKPPPAPRPEPEPEDEGLPRFPEEEMTPQTYGPSVRVRVYTPDATVLQSRMGDFGVQPLLVTRSGRRIGPVESAWENSGDGKLLLQESVVVFPELNEPPAALVWEVVEKGDPAPLLTFRMRDIPLPDSRPFVARLQPPVNPAAGTAGGGHAFFDPAGGSLVNRVEIAGRPASGGALQLGLAARVDGDWGPTRWIEVEVGPDGTARLEHLRPGAYRLIRVYHPPEGATSPTPPDGRWQNGQVEIAVGPREVAPPPLVWAPAAPAAKPPSPASRGPASRARR